MTDGRYDEAYKIEVQGCQAFDTARPQNLRFEEGLLTCEMITCLQVFPGRSKERTALLVGEAHDRDTIYAEDKGLKGGTDAFQAADGIDDACLQGRCVGNLEQWVDVFKINLPEPEDLDLLWVQGG